MNKHSVSINFKPLKRFLLFIWIITNTSFAQTASIGGIINAYTPVLSFDICKNNIIVEDASSFKAGDTVLLIQMKGATIDSANTSSFGSITNYNNAGNYEFNYVKSVAGNNVELLNIITRQYDIPKGKVQLIRVPYYQNATVSSRLSCLPWDGRKGGVLVLNVKDTIFQQSDIDVSGLGFSGGKVVNTNLLSVNCFTNNYYYNSASTIAAPKGESVYETGIDKTRGKGKLASAGGGGLDHNSGGGGGANGGSGGLGGYQLESCGNAPFDNRGIGGSALSYNNTINKIFLGGGGGAGHCNNPGGANMDGGNGGGIIIIMANYIKSNGFAIIDTGINAFQCIQTPGAACNDGSGGGGAGGTVLLSVNNFLDAASIITKGGKGGDLAIYAPGTGSDRMGPGGGGGGGIVWLKQAALPGSISSNNAGGTNGTIPQDANNPYGATPGQNGTTLFNLTLPVDNTLFKKKIDSVKAQTNIRKCSNVDFSGFVFPASTSISIWNWSLGDGTTANTQNTSHAYTNSGSYNIRLLVTDANGCQDSALTNLSVLVSPPPSFSLQAPDSACLHDSVRLIASGGDFFLWQPGSYLDTATISNPVFVADTTRTFTVIIKDTACTQATDTLSKTIKINKLPDINAYKSNDIDCFKLDSHLSATGGINYIWTPDYNLSQDSSQNPLAFPNHTQTYTVFATDSLTGCRNYDTTTVFVNFKMVYIFAPKAFSPNGDGLNDCFRGIYQGDVESIELTIFDRWGRKLFYTRNIQECWDGTYKGKPQDPGNYVYYIRAKNECDEKTAYGNLVLIR